ncbi:MAG: hypothetical protein IAE89_05115 [Anaerolineae bacterium]|nr:hypothetical protein [Anaerolineae bacterium]
MLILGLDGGGTKTAALLADDQGQVLGWSQVGGSNYHALGLERAYAAVRQAVEGALQGRSPDASCFSMASADTPVDFFKLNAKLGELGLPGVFTLRNDVMGIFRAGSRFPYGVGIVCGTGFNAGGISRSGKEIRFPALGSFTGDYGGGGDIAMSGIGAAFRAWDGRGEATLLQDAVLQAFNVPDFPTLAEHWADRKVTHDHVRHLAPLIFEISTQGDAVATKIIYEQGVELATAALAMLRRLDLMEVDCDVVLGGSLFWGKGDLLFTTVHQLVSEAAPYAQVNRIDVPPVVGALLLALESTGAVPAPELKAALRQNLPPELRLQLTI